jgi:hypothetical protein
MDLAQQKIPLGVKVGPIERESLENPAYPAHEEILP